ncbi:MAG: hypothetical protein PHU66_02790 [Bacteroidaceae bacterium]|jgi:hypothetical protein|nr:hypothetical protein [Bacteroidaceae bacterium]
MDKMQADFIINGSPITMEEMAMNSPEETKILIEDVLRIGSVKDSNIVYKMQDYFTSNPARKRLVYDVEKKYDNLGQLAKDLKESFGKLQQEKPSISIPHFYTQISGFNQSLVVGDSILGISLDKYMGADYAPYKKIFLKSQIQQMEQHRIVPDCIQLWLESKFPIPHGPHASTLDMMIHLGKLNWITSQIVGETYLEGLYKNINTDKAEWESNWPTISRTLLTRKNLLAKNDDRVRGFMLGKSEKEEASLHSEHNAELFAGITIVARYMKLHPQYTISNLLDNENSMDIFNGAGYTMK